MEDGIYDGIPWEERINQPRNRNLDRQTLDEVVATLRDIAMDFGLGVIQSQYTGPEDLNELSDEEFLNRLGGDIDEILLRQARIQGASSILREMNRKIGLLIIEADS